jgi:hypothetical protein
MVDYLIGHFTQENVESFIDKHASSWGCNPILVHLSWGCKRHLPVNVVALDMLDDSSKVGYNHQVINTADGVEFVQKKCAPLGIHFAHIKEMQEEYRRHVDDVVQNDLVDYVSTAYDNERFGLAERLLKAICQWYQRGVDVGDEVSDCRTSNPHITSCYSY